jgi:hypothetical protein
VAQLASWKCQVAVAVELKGKLYSGDWTQAYLNAINTAEQYMRVPDGIVRKYAKDGTAMVFRLAKAQYTAAKAVPGSGAPAPTTTTSSSVS